MIGDSHVNTVRVARTWEHWWHGNACFRAQGPNDDRAGFDFGAETGGQQSLCPPQLSYLSLLGQASTESQGPWDSNYQIEDDFSWFIPGKKGDHEIKVGARYNYTELERVSQINENGTFTINSDLAFNAADPRTYPERLSIRMGTFNEFIKNHSLELYAQDKWRIGTRTTLSLGVRYDLEIIPIDETDNPLFNGSPDHPVDRNNIAPRIGFSRTFDDHGKSVLRGGYGIFYNRTILGAIDDVLEQSKYTTSNVVNFPNASADPGPSAGRFPTDPMLVNGPFVNRTLLNQMFPPGARIKNAGVVIFDSPGRQQPFAHQATIGFGRELTPTIAINADFVHTANRDMFLARNLNPMVRANTTPDGRDHAAQRVRRTGRGLYRARVGDGEHRLQRLRRAEPLAREALRQQLVGPDFLFAVEVVRHRGEPGRQEHVPDRNIPQPRSTGRGRRASIAGTFSPLTAASKSRRRMAPPSPATFRYMSGAPFSIINSNIDADQNGELTDPSPAGTYSGTAPDAAVLTGVKNDGGRNGAIGPDYLQLDLRAGWRAADPRRTGDRSIPGHLQRHQPRQLRQSVR